jgi:alcohol dehydrogenase class IV
MGQSVFRVNPLIYFGPDSTQVLSQTPFLRAMVVTDPFMKESGMLDRVLSQLKGECRVFSEIRPDPDAALVAKGVKALLEWNPDLVIAFGGGSSIDAAKSIVHYAGNILGGTEKIRFFAIPTTSGTGSEVTNFSVITVDGRKMVLVDDGLLPDVAILDPSFTLSVPPSITADTGMDVLCHALEAYVSTRASNCSDAFAEKAVSLVFGYLSRAVKDGTDAKARSQLHDASCIAGMSFTNAGLGITHSLAHALGGVFHIAHGRANALLLPHVIVFNASNTKAALRYAKMAELLGLRPDSVADGVNKLITAVRILLKTVGILPAISEQGVEWAAFEEALVGMCRAALADECTETNPVRPTTDDLKDIYLRAYGARI